MKRFALALGLLVSAYIGSAEAESSPGAPAAPGPAESALQSEPAAPAYWKRNREGWFWYQDPPVETKQPPPKLAPKPMLTPQQRDLADFTAFKKRVEESLQAAVQNPSPENVARFLELQAESRRKASAFTDITRVVHARMPWLSANADGARPVNPVAADTFDVAQREQNATLMQQLAKTHGMYFFFRSDCRFCHAFAPMLKQFELKHGITVFAVSLDGGPIPHFPNAVRDNGTFMRILVDAGIPPEKVEVPFTALASPRTREVVPVGFGVMTADELADRIELAIRMKQQAAPDAVDRAAQFVQATSRGR